MARKSKADTYLTPENLKKITDWVSQGVTYETIAKNIGIAVSTFHLWINRYPELKKAVEGGAEGKTEVVMSAFFKLITGYKDTEVKVERYKMNGVVVENDPKYPIKETITTKVIPPNASAIIFYLKCKCGWTEKAAVELVDKRENPMSELTTEELRKLVNTYGKNEN